MEGYPMTTSVITNASALTALQNLNATATQLAQTQARISTGLKVSSAKDNGAIWAIAQNQRSTILSLDQVKDSLNRAQSTVDVAVSAGQSISDLLNQMKAKALAATDTSLDSTSVNALANDFKALRDQIAKIVANADFNGANMIKTGGSSVFALANAAGTNKLTVAAVNLGLGGGTVTVTAAGTFTTSATASAQLALVNTSITNVNAAVAKLGTGSTAVQTHLNFISQLEDTLTTGVGNLVDADVAKESANLTALQTKQQLGVQALSIANQGPQFLLSLFQGH
jgi:flagellin